MEIVNTHNSEPLSSYIERLFSDDIDTNDCNGERQQCNSQPAYITDAHQMYQYLVNDEHVESTLSSGKVEQHNQYRPYNTSDIARLFDLVNPHNVEEMTYQPQSNNYDCITPPSPQTLAQSSIPSYIEPTTSFESASSDVHHYRIPQANNYDYITSPQSAYGYGQHNCVTPPAFAPPPFTRQVSNIDTTTTATNTHINHQNEYPPINNSVSQRVYYSPELFNQSMSTSVTHGCNNFSQKQQYAFDIKPEDTNVYNNVDVVDTIEWRMKPSPPPAPPPSHSSSYMMSVDQSCGVQPTLTDSRVSVFLVVCQRCIYVNHN